MKEAYKSPAIVEDNSKYGVFPAIAGALALGIGMGLAKGKNFIDSKHTQTLTPRKTHTRE